MTETDALAALWREAFPDLAAPEVDVVGARVQLPSRLPVEEAAIACAGSAAMAAQVLHEARGGARTRVVVDRGHVSFAVRSERFFGWGGKQRTDGFAALSRFWRTSDGWIRTHANFPWHRAALLKVLNTSDAVADVAAAVQGSRSEDLEERIFAQGGVAAAVRSLDQWKRHPQGRVLGGEPLIGRQRFEAAATRRTPPAGDLPASGIRVLDLTRVIAGPVCTRFLGALGAEVLRLDPPHLPDLAPHAIEDTLLGKRSALLDLASAAAIETLHDLLAETDVVVIGYRPGSLDRFGLAPAELAARHSGLVAVYLDAWGHSGPWAGRRGFDSIVQAASGIALSESADGITPAALPCQLLDHGTGYLAAASALEGLCSRESEGGTQARFLSLARLAGWLASLPRQETPPGAQSSAEDVTPWLIPVRTPRGGVLAVAPPGRFGDRALRWPEPASGYGDSEPRWAPTGGTRVTPSSGRAPSAAPA